MAGPISYTNLSRVMYVQGFGWSAMMLFFPDIFNQVMGMPADAFKEKPMQLLRSMLTVCCISITALWCAVAQLEDAAQRKCHQYGTVVYAIVLYGFIMAKDILEPQMWQMNIAQCVVNLSLQLLVLYVWNKPATVISSNDASKTRACRISYINALLWGVLYLIAPEAVLTNFNCGAMMSSPYFGLLTTIVGAVICGYGMIFVAAAQLSSDDQHKLLQYGMINQFAFLFLFGAGGLGMYIMGGDQGAQKVQFCTMLNLGFICNAIHACYPSGLRMWIVRLLYILQSMTAVNFLLAPDFALASWGISDKAVLGGSTWLGVNMLSSALGAMAIAQCSDDVQKKYLQYSMFIPNAVVYYLAWNGLDVGQVVPMMLTFNAATIYDLYGDALMAKFGSGKSSMRTTTKASKSPRGRKRSSTPMKR